MYAIAGVSGNTGSVVADTLLSQGKQVRVIVRDAKKGEPWKARGAEVVVAELQDRGALEKALAGVEGAYLLIPPKLQSQTPLEDSTALVTGYAAAVKAAKVPHVVLLSSVGAQHATGVGPIRGANVAEQQLAPVTALTAVRASYFQDNWGSSLGMIDQGILPTFTPAEYPFPMVATPDIGRTAAAALVEGGRGKQIIDLQGPRDYSPSDVAAAVAQITGKPVKAQQFPLEGVVPTLTQFGISAQVAELFREMYEGAMTGKLAVEGGGRLVRGTVDITDTLKKLLGR